MSESLNGQKILYFFANSLVELSDQDWEQIKNIFKLKKLEKGDLFQARKTRASNFGFVLKGSFAVFYAESEGSRVIKSFVFENQLLGSYSSLLKGSVSKHEIIALEDSIIMEANYADFTRVSEKSSVWRKLSKILTEMEYHKSEDRIINLLQPNAETKLYTFINSYPDQVKRVPKKLLAAYLGINPSTLSRLLSKKK